MCKTRRDFLKSSAALAAGMAVLRNTLPAMDAGKSGPAQTKLSQFEYGEVQLLDGPMLEQFHNNVSLFLSLPDDDLLKPFRQFAGLPAPGEDMGGWYSPSSDFDPPKNMTVLTRAQLMAAQRAGSESSDWEVASGAGKVRLKPFPAITSEHYRLYHEV